MNKKSELLARLAELGEAEDRNEEQTPTANGGFFDPLPDGWKPKPRFVPEKHVEDSSVGFQIGQWWKDRNDARPFRQAFPRPTYKDCGAKSRRSANKCIVVGAG
jgi:hypothetical protein